MNNLDIQYKNLLNQIIISGKRKNDRTSIGTLSIFGYQIRHNMSEGFPLLTTKKMAWKQIVLELIWFLRGDTNIKYLVDNDCHIWDGDAYKKYERTWNWDLDEPLPKDKFIERIKTDEQFAKTWGELGPVYGKQWRRWEVEDTQTPKYEYLKKDIDQIQNLINELKINPDSRRLIVSSWNVGELQSMTLPPCHYSFQIYTRELSIEERWNILKERAGEEEFKRMVDEIIPFSGGLSEELVSYEIPERSISLMWNQRSVDVFLGLPFNIASYGLLLEIIAKEVNMVPDQLIGSLGDVHLYLNHLDQAKEQIGNELTLEERIQWVLKNREMDLENVAITEEAFSSRTPSNTREPFDLPRIKIDNRLWDKTFMESIYSDEFCKSLLERDIQILNYKSHPKIKAPLNN